MNNQMTSAEIDVSVCGRSSMSVKEKFTGLDKFDALLGPHEESVSPACRALILTYSLHFVTSSTAMRPVRDYSDCNL